MLPDRVSNPGPLTYESGALPIALRGPALLESNRSNFYSLLNEYDEVFNPSISGYYGAVGKFEATINMGPVLPPTA